MADAAAPEPESSPTPKGPAQSPWARTVFWMFIFGLLSLNVVFFFRSCRNLPGETMDKAGGVIEKAGRALADVAAAFRQGTIRTEFFSYATTVSDHQYLQFATLKQMEVFSHSERTSTAFGYIPLPEVVVEARAPVEYTYYVDLKTNWNFVVHNGALHVFAPSIRFNKPAIDASRITFEVKKGYLKSEVVQENLKNTLTGLSVFRARENVSLVRENGRRQITEFVEQWLRRSFADGAQYPVRVYFPGETPPAGVDPAAPATNAAPPATLNFPTETGIPRPVR